MTPREQSTLDAILHDVAKFNGRDVSEAIPPRTTHLVVLGGYSYRVFELQIPSELQGDIVIDGVTFRPTGAQCA